MLEDDEFCRDLIHSYGGKGIALVRLKNLSDDEELNDLARQDTVSNGIFAVTLRPFCPLLRPL